MKNKGMITFGFLALLGLSNTSFFGGDNSKEDTASLASRLPPMQLISAGANKIERLDLCGEGLDRKLNERVDLMRLFIATAEVTSGQIGETVKLKDQVFNEKLRANLAVLEKNGFDQVDMMNAGEEGITFCLPKLLDLAMGEGSRSYLGYDEKLHRLTNYLGHQGIVKPEILASHLLFMDSQTRSQRE